MTFKQYKTVQIAVLILISIIFSQTFAANSLALSLGVLLAGSLLLLFLRKRVKEVILDEMSYAIGGKAALAAIQIFCWLAVIMMLAANAMKHFNPIYGTVCNIMAFSACLLMLIYSASYQFFAKISWKDPKLIITLLLVLIFFSFFILSVFVKPL
ncbi:MAG: DUF2178 domain-containing protein [Candidatus Paceibacterota bacterium]